MACGTLFSLGIHTQRSQQDDMKRGLKGGLGARGVRGRWGFRSLRERACLGWLLSWAWSKRRSLEEGCPKPREQWRKGTKWGAPGRQGLWTAVHRAQAGERERGDRAKGEKPITKLGSAQRDRREMSQPQKCWTRAPKKGEWSAWSLCPEG